MTAAGLLATAVLAPAPRARADPALACPSGQGVVSATAPAFARQGRSVAVSLHVSDPTRVGDVSVTFLSGSTVDSSAAVEPSAGTTVVSQTAPAAGTTLTVGVAWAQDAGIATACQGTEVLKIPLIGATGNVGDPSRPRLTGRFSLVERPVNYTAPDSRPTWSFTPVCAYFACAGTLRSSQGLTLALALGPRGLYHGHISAGAGVTATSCTVPHEHLSTITDAYTLREDVYIRIRQSSGGVATRISGSLIGTYTPTRSARRRGCSFPERAVEQFTGLRSPTAPAG